MRTKILRVGDSITSGVQPSTTIGDAIDLARRARDAECVVLDRFDSDDIVHPTVASYERTKAAFVYTLPIETTGEVVATYTGVNDVPPEAGDTAAQLAELDRQAHAAGFTMIVG